MASKPILFSYFRSSASWRVRIALAIKGVDYEYKPVNLLKNEQISDDYKAKNPMGQVPALYVEGVTLTQSLPIIEYLEETHPGKNLLPKDPILRAQARQVAEIINSGIQPIQNLSIIKTVALYTGKEEDKAKWANHFIRKGFIALEAVLKRTSGTYCVGDEVTVADLALVPQVQNAKRFNVDLEEFPIITRINATLIELEPFKKADPSNQPDCPEDLKK